MGDFDVDAMEAKVRAAFGDWKPTAADGPEPDLGTVAPRQPQTSILVEPGIQSSIQINWIKAPDLSPDTAEKRIQSIRRSLGLAVLNRRLGEIARADNPPFLGAGGSYLSHGPASWFWPVGAVQCLVHDGTGYEELPLLPR